MKLRKMIDQDFRRLAEIFDHEVRDGQLLLTGDTASMLISSPAPGVVRLRTGRGGSFAEDRSFAVACKPEPGPAPTVDANAERLVIGLGGLTLTVGRKPFTLSVRDADDHLLFRDHPRVGIGSCGDAIVFSAGIDLGAHFYGFGEKTGPLDKYGESMTMWTSDKPYTLKTDPLYLSIPWTLLLREGRACGLFFDEPGRSQFDVGHTWPGVFAYLLEAGELDLYIIDGPRPADVLDRYTALTGRMPMPPRWALGHHQCRWSYMNDAEVRDLAKNFRERGIPTDAIWFDIHYMDRYRLFTFDTKRFPDMKRLTTDLAGQGFKTVAAVDPGVHAAADFPLYRDGQARSLFCKDESGAEFNSRVWPGKVGFPDFTNPEAREWWGRAHQPLLDAGIAGIWNDMNEPSAWSFDVRPGLGVLPLWPVRDPKIVHHDAGRNTPHRRLRNVYGLLECDATRQGLLAARPGVRPFILTRSGYAGIQRLAAVWTGDNASKWSHLALSLPMLLNLGLSGVALCGPDIGGFMWSSSPELYARWIQLGAFYPFCRTHSSLGSRRQEPWSFGPAVERIAAESLRLRYRLHPTLYSLIRDAHDTGAPVLRPLFWEFPDDKVAPTLEDQCLFGPSLLLAPVLNKGARKRSVYLPAGGWTDFWTGERLAGPRVVERDAPLDLMPIYVRAGAVLFMWPARDWLDQAPPERVFVDLYPGAGTDTTATLYEDDGQSEDWRDGKFCRRRFGLRGFGGAVTVEIAAAAGDWRPPARELCLRIHLEQRPTEARLDGAKLALDGDGPSGYDPNTRVLRVTSKDDAAAHRVELT